MFAQFALMFSSKLKSTLIAQIRPGKGVIGRRYAWNACPRTQPPDMDSETAGQIDIIQHGAWIQST